MKLIGAIASPYVARVLMFARIKGIDLQAEPTPGDSLKSEEYLALTPIGKMPALVVDDQCIAESEVICEYIEDAYPEPSGLPADPLGRATSRLISRITDLYVSPHTGPLFRQMNPATRDQSVVDEKGADMKKGFGYLEHFMGAGPFCVSDAPTLGDCALSPYMMLLKKSVFPSFTEIKDPTEGNGRLATWWQAIQGNENCMEILEEYSEAVDNFMKMIRASLSGKKN